MREIVGGAGLLERKIVGETGLLERWDCCREELREKDTVTPSTVCGNVHFTVFVSFTLQNTHLKAFSVKAYSYRNVRL